MPSHAASSSCFPRQLPSSNDARSGIIAQCVAGLDRAAALAASASGRRRLQSEQSVEVASSHDDASMQVAGSNYDGSVQDAGSDHYGSVQLEASRGSGLGLAERRLQSAQSSVDALQPLGTSTMASGSLNPSQSTAIRTMPASSRDDVIRELCTSSGSSRRSWGIPHPPIAWR